MIEKPLLSFKSLQLPAIFIKPLSFKSARLIIQKTTKCLVSKGERKGKLQGGNSQGVQNLHFSKV